MQKLQKILFIGDLLFDVYISGNLTKNQDTNYNDKYILQNIEKVLLGGGGNFLSNFDFLVKKDNIEYNAFLFSGFNTYNYWVSYLDEQYRQMLKNSIVFLLFDNNALWTKIRLYNQNNEFIFRIDIPEKFINIDSIRDFTSWTSNFPLIKDNDVNDNYPKVCIISDYGKGCFSYFKSNYKYLLNKDTILIIDPHTNSIKQMYELLPKLKENKIIIKLNKYEWEEYKTYDKLLKLDNIYFIVTQGKDNPLYYYKGKKYDVDIEEYVDLVPKKLVNTCGAGDLFFAYFCYYLIKSNKIDLKEIIRESDEMTRMALGNYEFKYTVNFFEISKT